MQTEIEPLAKIILDARSVSLAWLNASLAASKEETRTVLYRTVSLEFFDRGLQIIGCDGTILIRSWIPIGAAIEFPPIDEEPLYSIVVFDEYNFIKAFLKTLNSAIEVDSVETLVISVTTVEDEAMLSPELAKKVVNLTALGQNLQCKVYEGAYPRWRSLDFGMPGIARVEALRIASRMFSILGKIKGVDSIDLKFHGHNKHISFDANEGTFSTCGIVMPMHRKEEV